MKVLVTGGAGDVRDLGLLLDVFPGHDIAVHFAAESHVDRSVQDAAEFVATNAGGTQTVLEACLRAGVGRVVYISTDEVYGSVTTGSWTGASPLDPNSPYAASKAAGDLLAQAYWRTHGLNVSLTRCCNNYAPLLQLCGAGWDMVKYVDDRKGHDLRYSVDDTKIRSRLGYQPSVPFERGLAAVVGWYYSNRSWWEESREA